MNENLKTTLKAWPAIAAATIGLCFLTQCVAGLFGVNLPDQQNVEIVRQWMRHAFDSWDNTKTCAFLLAQIILLLPVLEEIIFRWLLWRLPAKLSRRIRWRTPSVGRWPVAAAAVLSSSLFSAAHYITQPFPDAAFIALFFFGLAQCRLYAKTGRMWCPVLNHVLFNLTNLALLVVFK